MNKELEKKAIERLKFYETPDDPYYLAYSGGKDSDCIKILAELSGVKYQAYHNLTSVDAPETVNYVKSQKDVIIQRKYWDYEHKNPITMWNLIPKKKMPPTRIVRYCCSELKEWGGKGRKVVTGVRWAESRARAESSDVVKILTGTAKVKKLAEEINAKYVESRQGGIILNNDNAESRELVEMCYMQHKTTINPIIDWSDSDVWEFLRHYGCESNPLYQCGYHRIGCIGCPMAGKHRYVEFERYPKFKENYIKAFQRMIDYPGYTGKWKNGEDVFRWWMGEDLNQLTFEQLLDMQELQEEYE